MNPNCGTLAHYMAMYLGMGGDADNLLRNITVICEHYLARNQAFLSADEWTGVCQIQEGMTQQCGVGGPMRHIAHDWRLGYCALILIPTKTRMRMKTTIVSHLRGSAAAFPRREWRFRAVIPGSSSSSHPPWPCPLIPDIADTKAWENALGDVEDVSLEEEDMFPIAMEYETFCDEEGIVVRPLSFSSLAAYMAVYAKERNASDVAQGRVQCLQ